MQVLAEEGGFHAPQEVAIYDFFVRSTGLLTYLPFRQERIPDGAVQIAIDS